MRRGAAERLESADGVDRIIINWEKRDGEGGRKAELRTYMYVYTLQPR